MANQLFVQAHSHPAQLTHHLQLIGNVPAFLHLTVFYADDGDLARVHALVRRLDAEKFAGIGAGAPHSQYDLVVFRNHVLDGQMNVREGLMQQCDHLHNSFTVLSDAELRAVVDKVVGEQLVCGSGVILVDEVLDNAGGDGFVLFNTHGNLLT